MSEASFLSVRALRVRYPERRRWRGGGPARPAVDDVAFTIARGETLALVGESGSGKTTVARALLRLVPVESGEVVLDGVDVLALAGDALRRIRRRMQVVFQDPFTSLNPRMTVGAVVGEGIAVHGLARGDEAARRVARLLEEVELGSSLAAKYPHELSGGQRQRVAIARALAVDPDFLVLDEAVSALDVTTQARLLALFARLRTERGLTALFIAHNLAVVQQVAQTVAVMHGGRIVELAPSSRLFRGPEHEHTRALLEAVPNPDPAAPRLRAARGVSADSSTGG